MKIATAQQMRAIDEQAIKQYGIPEIVLMENAGVSVAKSVDQVIGKIGGKKICIFAGKGNNGGDGFVAARHLSNQGAKVKVYIIGDMQKIQGAAKVNLEILQKMCIEVLPLLSERDWDKVKIALTLSDCLIDALIGTGFKNQLQTEMEKVINMMNDIGKPIIAIDLPSGVEANTGKVPVTAIKATLTVSLGLTKVGLILYPGAAHAGEILVADIGLPNVLLVDEHIKQNMINTNIVKRLLIKRMPDVHKGSCGKVLVIAGSTGLTGAAVLASNAAIRAGAGIVTLAIAQSLHDIVETKLTEVMTYPLPELKKGVLGESALPELLRLAPNYDVIEIGSGLGRDPETLQMVREFIRQADKQIIIDADAIHAYQGMGEKLREAKIMPILTPHLGEMANLLNLSISEIKDDLIGTARAAAEKFNAIIVLKSARTVVAYPDGNVYINIRGNAGMATAGTGDVLAGVISGLFAQGLLSYSAAITGVYLHAFAGDLVAGSGMVGLISSDIVNVLPAARLGIEE